MTTTKNSQVLRTIPLLITICLSSFPAQAKYGGGMGEPSEHYGHTVIVRVVKVTPDWVPYKDTSGWTQAVTTKESEYLKYFEVAIWVETASIHLYEFPNDYDPHYGYRGNTTDDENIAYREQFALEVFTGLPGTDYRDERSEFIRNAFYSFIDTICDRYGESNHGLTYSGHGGAGGALFTTSLAPKHAQDLLLYWTTRAGKKLAFIDMGGPCKKGAYTDLSTFCPYLEYYIASDLNNGGYTFDDWTYEKYLETNPDDRYHDLIADHASLIEVLKARIDIRRKAYEYGRNNMIQNKVEQSQYLYSSANFKEFHDAIEAAGEIYPSYSDMYSFIREDVYLRDLFNSVIVYKADNRDFFDWEVEANGILTPNTLNGVFSDALISIEYPVLDFPPPPTPANPLSEALDTALSFTTGGSADWFSQTTMTYYGPDAAQSGDISHRQDSWMQTTVSGTATVKFYWKVSSEEDFDFLEFYIDGSLQDKISGSDGDWEWETYTISTSGSHTLEWRYMKDGSGNVGSDCGWVDKVEFVAN